MMFNIGENLKNILLAGIGAVAMTTEKSKEMIEELVKKGELTVEQGKVLNEELKRKVSEKVKDSGALDAIKNVTGTSAEAIARNLEKLTLEELAQIKEKINEIEASDKQGNE
ncbi:hypothetical protein SDC9_155058 [bioreactor metagenome]|uniref:Poly(Hydroxyalcanoate) granule associated protein (Phasin) n=1 Tax=bioreactor metagenome TaxID=1076179 RepID=A0A645F2B6_9ZZZZ